MTTRFQAGRRGQPSFLYEIAKERADRRGTAVWLVVGSRPVVVLPGRFNLTQRWGAVVWHEHISDRGHIVTGHRPGLPTYVVNYGEGHVQVLPPPEKVPA